MKRHVSTWEHVHIWRHLFWLPEPIYYWLLDTFGDGDGWRPLFYAHCKHAWISGVEAGPRHCSKCQVRDGVA